LKPKSEKITFTCELKGCNKKRTVKISQYNTNSKHFCSITCSSESRKTEANKKYKVFKCKECNKKVLEKDSYRSHDYTYSSYCGSCREDRKVNRLAELEISRDEFIKRFNSMDWNNSP